MFKIKLGLFLLIVSSTVFAGFFVLSDGVMNTPLFEVSIFVIAGLIFLIDGLRQVIRDYKTKKYGTKCYGIISEIQPTGSYENGKTEYKALVYFVNPETRSIEELEEIIGFDYNEFQLDSYVECQYYKGDINIIKHISGESVPEEIIEYLEPERSNSVFFNISFSDDREYVTIDGAVYKRDN